MRLTKRLYCLLGAILIVTITRPATVGAHGTDYRLLNPESAVVVEFIYADNQPMRYAEVLVYSPENDRIEYQNGRTDMNGRFAFYPVIPGTWRIQADDGTGHLQRVSLDIAPDEDGKAGMGSVSERSQSTSDHHHAPLKFWGILLGISLIINLFMGFYLVKTGGRVGQRQK